MMMTGIWFGSLITVRGWRRYNLQETVENLCEIINM